MPLEAAAALRDARTTLDRWHALRAAYDAIEDALAAPEQTDLRALAARVVELEADLEPRIAELAAARSRVRRPGPELAATWKEIDATVTSLASRQPRLVRAALAARAATAQRLDELRVARAQLRRYAAASSGRARLTSRSA